MYQDESAAPLGVAPRASHQLVPSSVPLPFPCQPEKKAARQSITGNTR
jgi:hypothetical protein